MLLRVPVAFLQLGRLIGSLVYGRKQMTTNNLPQTRESDREKPYDMRALGQQIAGEHKEAFDRLAKREAAEAKRPSSAAAD